ncbi:uncharacterized protein LOC114541384 [Dendronephthya gigantea]|uniref:uncharacterized protein LOC114541384 n=1 Tax=Dendronephthya gigantea TaxID=151771 RepID=UPI00106C7E61|nr:uncharacterized protein LOC114541384 [Dendronephthya gigantea]
MRSTSSYKAKAAARQAALEAGAISLQKLHDLELEELKIKQKRSQVELQGEISAAAAEKTTFEGFEEVEETLSSKEGIITDSALPKTRNSTNGSQHANPVLQQRPKLRPTQPTEVTRESHSLNPTSPAWFPDHAPEASQPGNYPLANPLQHLMETQDRQNVALQQIVQQQQQSVMALTLPQPTIKPFKGDHIEYCDFVRSFEHRVEEKTPSSSARLYYLIQYTSGPVQDLMRSCLSMNPERGYVEARRLLKERYRQKYRVAAAHIETLTEGPAIKSEDGNALMQFSIQLTSCTNTLKEIGSLEKLNHPENLKRIINQLPFGIRLKWRDTVDRIVEKDGRDVTIEDVTEFVTAKARAATHPIFGKITSDPKGKLEEHKGKRQYGARASRFGTQGKE